MVALKRSNSVAIALSIKAVYQFTLCDILGMNSPPTDGPVLYKSLVLNVYQLCLMDGLDIVTDNLCGCLNADRYLN